MALYTGPAGEALPLDPDAVLDAVRVYVAAAKLGERFDEFEVVDVSTDAESVTVTLRAVRKLPLLGILGGAADGGIEIEASATARAPYVD